VHFIVQPNLGYTKSQNLLVWLISSSSSSSSISAQEDAESWQNGTPTNS